MATNRFRYNLSAPVLLIDESPQALCERKPPFGHPRELNTVVQSRCFACLHMLGERKACFGCALSFRAPARAQHYCPVPLHCMLGESAQLPNYYSARRHRQSGCTPASVSSKAPNNTLAGSRVLLGSMRTGAHYRVSLSRCSSSQTRQLQSHGLSTIRHWPKAGVSRWLDASFRMADA